MNDVVDDGPVATDDAPYDGLDPDTLLDAVESAGFACDGSLTALNSYENRVYQLGIEGAAPLIAKFYRPGRWSDAAIAEEHRFSRDLAALDLPVVGPLINGEGQSLFHYRHWRFCLFPRRGGRPVNLEDPDVLFSLGRLIGRIHAAGATRDFEHRPTLDVQSFGVEPTRFVLDRHYVPEELQAVYASVTEDVLQKILRCYERAGDVRAIRLHGDCHSGNLMWDDGPLFVDLDDCRMGPAVQDLWMLLSGERNEQTAQLSEVLEGYSEFFDFNGRELNLIEPLRTLRMLHHSAWLARRWNDPAFPRAFPWFGESRYWEEQILALREQSALLDEPALSWRP